MTPKEMYQQMQCEKAYSAWSVRFTPELEDAIIHMELRDGCMR